MRALILALAVMTLTACDNDSAYEAALKEVQEEQRIREQAEAARLAAFEERHGVSVETVCRYEARMFEDTRKAWVLDGDTATLTPREKTYREELETKLAADFRSETGKEYEDVYSYLVTAHSKHGHSC